MAILSTLLQVTEPSGVWITIIKAFEGFCNNYVLAVILLTVIIRLIWAPMDTLNKKMTSKMTLMQEKMKPEMDKLHKKYGHDPKLLKQKQNELYQKNNTSSIGSCLFMLVFMALNMAIFFTLFSGLNAMAVYKINSTYENLKYEYANSLSITKEYLGDFTDNTKLAKFENYQNLSFERIIDGEGEEQKEYIVLYEIVGEEKTELIKKEYKYDFSTKGMVKDEETGEEVEKVTETTNQYLIKIINDIFANGEDKKEIVVGQKEVTNENGEISIEDLYLSEAYQASVMKLISNTYLQTKNSFLWIDNIWVTDTPFQKSVFDFNKYQSQVGKANIEEGEDIVYNSFMTDLSNDYGRVNGYLILPILIVLASLLSMFLATYKRKKDRMVPNAPQPGGRAMKIIMPVILGMFALFYNSVFSIYMLVGQLISAMLMPLENLIVNKWNNRTRNKQEKKVEVEYSRKF